MESAPQSQVETSTPSYDSQGMTFASKQDEEKGICRRSVISRELVLQLLARGQAFERTILRALTPLVAREPELRHALDQLTLKNLSSPEYEAAYKKFRMVLQKYPHLHERFHVELRQDRYALFKQAQEIVPGVLLSSEFPLLDGERLLASGVTHVVQCNQVGQRIPGIVYLNLNMRDCETQNARASFEPAFEFISSAIDENKNVLVHCEMGVSRSATVVIAYCMRAARLDYEDSAALVRSQRPIIDPNTGFISQLMNFESHISFQKLFPQRVTIPEALEVPLQENYLTSSAAPLAVPESVVPKKRSLKSYFSKALGL